MCIGSIKVYYCFAIPYYLGFNNTYEGTVIPLDFAFDVFLFFDIIFQVSTAYIKEARLIDDRIQILKNGLKSGLIIDLLCVIPLYAIYNELMWFRVLRLLQLGALKSALEITVIFY